MPLDNICYLLFLDLVEWYSSEDKNTSRMRYKFPATTQFWQVGYRIFHGKFIRFMSGTKNLGQIISNNTDKGYFDPNASSINFAVPSLTTLHKRLENNSEYLPGVNLVLIEDIRNHYDGLPMVLGVDVKRLVEAKENKWETSNVGDSKTNLQWMSVDWN